MNGEPQRTSRNGAANRTADLATITVTYHPDLAVLRAQLMQLPSEAMKIVVDNASQGELKADLRRLVESFGAEFLENEANIGLAAATNQGIDRALAAGCKRVLFLDQDTEPGESGVASLCAVQDRLRDEDPTPACVGPRLVDAVSGMDHGFHQIRGWRWVRVRPAAGDHAPIRCANLNGSGTIVPREILEALGGLEADFFIDHVDTEWAFRVLANGYGLLGAPGISFRHRMGERTWRFWWFGWRIWPYRSALRHRYLFRNAVCLMRRPQVPLVWKAWAMAKLASTMAIHAAFDASRRSQVRAMTLGASDGLKGRMGGLHD